MLKPDFKKYSLALIKENRIIFYSNKSGLRPLIECIKKYRLKFKDYILHDKIVGFAAARVIVYSNTIDQIFTKVVSKPAQELLIENRIKINAKETVKNILNNKKTDICPMEKKAEKIEDNEKFYLELIKSFK